MRNRQRWVWPIERHAVTNAKRTESSQSQRSLHRTFGRLKGGVMGHGSGLADQVAAADIPATSPDVGESSSAKT